MAPIRTYILSQESKGNAFPIVDHEQYSFNGYVSSRLMFFGDLLGSGMNVTGGVAKFPRFMVSGGNAKATFSSGSTTSTTGVSSLKASTGLRSLSGSNNSWNQFLKANKGKYSGSGWQKRAASDYYKSHFFNLK